MTDNISLVQRLAKATAEVGGKLKADKRNGEQGYNYVSADKILSACGQALADNGVVVIPSIVHYDINIIDRGNGKSRYDATVDLVLKVTDGATSFEEPWYGMGSDYSVPDKALYKAITSGHKYFLSKLFCIGEGNEDGEHESEDGDKAPVKQNAPQQPRPNGNGNNGKPPAQPAPAVQPQAAPPEPAPVVVDEQPHVTYTGALAKIGKDHAFPTLWGQALMPKLNELGGNAYHLGGILWKLNIPQETTPARVVEMVKEYLAQQ